MKLVNVKCNHLVNPLGIDTTRPVFSWQLADTRNDIWQKSYRIQVSDACGNRVWDSGICESQECVSVRYAGEALKSRGAYTYDVSVENNLGEVSYSRGNSFEMGILDAGEWKAKWVGRQPLVSDGETEPKPDMGQILLDMMAGKDVDFRPDRKLEQLNTFSRKFVLDAAKTIGTARAYVTALGLYELKINGETPKDVRFAPEFTAYDKYIEYQTYDITELLHGGENEVEVTLADGWYKGKFGILGFGDLYGSELAFLLQMEVEYTDDSAETIVSDEEFTYSASPYLYSDIMIGERYDARLEDAPKEKTPCHVMDYGYEKLHGVCAAPVIVTRRVPVKEVLVTPAGETVLDFGQNLVGVVEMKVSGPAGTVVQLEHSEVLDADGNYINCVDGFNRDQADFYVLKGAYEETYQPKFTFHGFRYVHVAGYPGEVKAENFTACVLGSDCASTSMFQTSNPKLNQLQSNIVWGQRGNLLSIPTDCPQRERAGWTGDAWVYAETCCFNQDMLAFFYRWLRNIRAEQFADGLVPIVVPYSPGYKDIQLQSFGTHTSAGWGDVIIELPWRLYQIYGDKTVLEENYDAMKKWMSYVEHEASTGVHMKPENEGDEKALSRQKYLWNTNFHYGDWLYPSCKDKNGETDMFRSAVTTKEHVATAIYANSTDLMAKTAEVLGDAETCAYYRDLNAKIRKAFEEEYVGADGRIDNDIQGLYVMALAMDLVGEEKKPLLAARLAEKIAENGGCLDTGFMSIKFLMGALSENGKKDSAKTILYQEKSPSWFYEINHGATTIWESWDAVLPDGSPSKYSMNHYAFGCIGAWMYQNLLGIRAAAPGYREILIRPDFDFDLDYVQGSYDSIYGTITVKWRIEDGKKRLFVQTPPNTSVTVELPDGTKKSFGNGAFELQLD